MLYACLRAETSHKKGSAKHFAPALELRRLIRKAQQNTPFYVRKIGFEILLWHDLYEDPAHPWSHVVSGWRSEVNVENANGHHN